MVATAAKKVCGPEANSDTSPTVAQEEGHRVAKSETAASRRAFLALAAFTTATVTVPRRLYAADWTGAEAANVKGVNDPLLPHRVQIVCCGLFSRDRLSFEDLVTDLFVEPLHVVVAAAGDCDVRA
jgi:hypothetical protein